MTVIRNVPSFFDGDEGGSPENETCGFDDDELDEEFGRGGGKDILSFESAAIASLAFSAAERRERRGMVAGAVASVLK